MLSWLPFIVATIGLTAAVKTVASRPVTDPDTWWHLRLGSEFLGGWSLSAPGYLTSFGTEQWKASQWLPEILAFVAADRLGLGGVIWMTALGTIGLALALYFASRALGEPLAAGITAMLGLVGAFGSVAPRPQLLSFALLALVLSAWLRSAQDLKPRWWLVPLGWLWACSHGMWFLGPLVGFTVVVGLALDRSAGWQELKKLLLIPLMSVVVAGLTPVGPSLIWLSIETRGNQEFITEWAPVSITCLPLTVTVGMVALVVITWSRRPVRNAWPQILLLAMAVGWALLAGRTVALGAIIAAPLLAGALQSWLRRQSCEVSWKERSGAGAVSVVVALLAAVWVPAQPVNLDKFPESLSGELQQIPEDSVVYNDYFLGGWLSWRHPHLDGVIDGMTHAYTADWVTTYVETQGLNKGWYEHVTSTQADFALLESDAPLAIELQAHYEWSIVAKDRQAGYVLLSAPDS